MTANDDISKYWMCSYNYKRLYYFLTAMEKKSQSAIKKFWHAYNLGFFET